MDFDQLIKDVGSKTTIEDSVDTLVIEVANELMANADNPNVITDLAAKLVMNHKALSSAVAENT